MNLTGKDINQLSIHDAIGRFDHVTHLPNRLPFLDRIENELNQEYSDSNSPMLVLATLADAPHYNQILRALGHAFADDFVRQAAHIIENILPDDMEIYHVSVLSIAFIMPKGTEHAPETIAETISRAFDQPVLCQTIPIRSNLGVGLVDLQRDIGTAPEALRAALTAAQDSRGMYARHSYYDATKDAAHRRAFQLLTDLPAALEVNDQLELHYQPRIRLSDKKCVGAEALLRWTHPEFGPVSPAEFLPLVETTALITPLTEYVLRQVTRAMADWYSRGLDLKVSMNVSPRNVAEPDFMDKIKAILDHHNIPADKMELEFTEGAIPADDKRLLSHLQHAREMGIEVAIDDFGSGYSNMAYLNKIPADTVKIDQAFIRFMHEDPRTVFILTKIINLAKGLGFKTVGEGIETAEAADFLHEHGCIEGQGYFFAKPMPESEFPGWFTKWED